MDSEQCLVSIQVSQPTSKQPLGPIDWIMPIQDLYLSDEDLFERYFKLAICHLRQKLGVPDKPLHRAGFMRVFK